MTIRQDLVKKWEPILEHKSLPEIKDNYRKGTDKSNNIEYWTITKDKNFIPNMATTVDMFNQK
jgi:hypothetical protein